MGGGDPRAAEDALRLMTQELQRLQESLVAQLSQDVEWLQAEKQRLVTEIQDLQSERQAALSQYQLAQQQRWAKQLAQVLAAHLQKQLVQQLSHQPSVPQRLGAPTNAYGHSESFNNGYGNDRAYQIISSLDLTLSTTFKSMQQELSSYQSSLSQQLGRMHSLEQQGEAILAALVNRLSEQLLQMELSQVPRTSLTSHPPTDAFREDWPISAPSHPYDSGSAAGNRLPSQLTDPPSPSSRSSEATSIQVGLFLVLLSSICLSLFNVLMRIGLKQQTIFQWLGWNLQWGGVITPSVGNSLLILFLRMVFVLPLMAPLAQFLYPPVWQDIKRFLISPDKGLRRLVFGSGVCLFVSQLLIFIAFGHLPAGIVVTLFFIYPIATLFLSWLLLGDRPSLFRMGVSVIVALGVGLILMASPGSMNPSGNMALGMGTALSAGIGFAFFVILTQKCTQRLSPVPITLIQFSSIFILSGLFLTLPLPFLQIKVDPSRGPELFLLVLLLALATLGGYLLNNYGIRRAGAARAAIVGATGPAFTAILAFALIGETLKFLQVGGVLLVTLGVVALSFERLRGQGKTAPKPKAA